MQGDQAGIHYAGFVEKTLFLNHHSSFIES